MSSSASRLHLLIPFLFDLPPNQEVPLLPRLERLLSRADISSAPGEDYLSTLFSLFGRDLPTTHDLPEGAVNYHAKGGDTGDACWMRADPVYLRPDRDRLLLFGCDQLDITAAEADAIAAEFNDHFEAEGLRLVIADGETWYLRLGNCPHLRTHGLREVTGHHIEPFMPEGEDAKHWRRLLNEMQMLLFRSPVNQKREEQGRLSINGIWLSGVGRLPQAQPAEFAAVIGEDPSVVGLASLAGLQAQTLGDAGEAWWRGAESLSVVTDLVSPALNADPYAWSETLAGLEQRLERLADGIGGSSRGQLLIYPCNGQIFRISRNCLRRFWRRDKSLGTWKP